MNEKEAPIVYQADPYNREYIGTSFADQSPLEPGVWLIPGMATLEKPPKEKPGKAIVLNMEGGWDYTEDNRGAVYLKKNGKKIDWLLLGSLPDEYTKIIWPGEFFAWSGSDWVLDPVAKKESDRMAALETIDSMLREAALRIAPLQDAFDLDDASDEEIALLKKWKQYRVSVNRVPDQAGFPENIKWPEKPA